MALTLVYLDVEQYLGQLSSPQLGAEYHRRKVIEENDLGKLFGLFKFP